MRDVVLTFSTHEGSETILLEKDKTSFGRGGEADYRFDDNGLSRLHAIIYKENDQVWIVDENSSNGTFVNGERVATNGTPISEGDTVKIGNHTNLVVSFEESFDSIGYPDQPETLDEPNAFSTASVESEKPSILFPMLITGVALLVITGAAVFIGVNVMRRDQPRVVENIDPYDDFDDDNPKDDVETTTTPSPTQPSNTSSSPSPESGQVNSESANLTNSPTANRQNSAKLPSGKKYQSMSATEKDQYVKTRAEKVARIIGNKSGQSIPPEAVTKIKRFLNGYVSKLRAAKRNDCTTRGWRKSDMVSILDRARKNAPFIIHAFNKKGIDPQVGLYLAMIESEHCPCLQSPTGPLGMFQFTRATARRFGLDARSGASPSNPDERCQPKAAARAAAGYMKSLTGRIGTGPLSIPLAIASYNSGEGGLGKNLKTALEANESQERSFWTLVANSEKLAKQFQTENIKYVPKFFAAAIIGENPRDFGVGMQPLSTYTR